MDLLRLDGIEVPCIIGDQPEERLREQRLLVSVALELDLGPSASSDSLSDTVDYASLTVRIREAVRAARCRLVERAAALAVAECLADPRVARATATVRKSGSVPGLAAAEATMSRGRSPGSSGAAAGRTADREIFSSTTLTNLR